MCLVVSVLAATLAANAPDPVPRAAPSVAAAQKQPESDEALRDLCHGEEPCWRVVMTPPQHGAFLVQAKFPDASRFIGPGDPYCERREYWHVAGFVHRLLAADCAEQWGPDGAAPVLVTLEKDKIKLTYLKWGYDSECEKAVALLDFATAKLVSLKWWKGVASQDRSDCRRIKPLKAPAPGDGRKTPLVPFNSDSLPDVRSAGGSGGQSGH